MILKFTKHHVKSHASNIPNIIFKTYFHYSKNQSKNHVSNRSLSSKNPIISLVRLIPSSAAGIFPLSCHSAKESSFGSSDILASPLRLTKKPYKMLLSIPRLAFIIFRLSNMQADFFKHFSCNGFFRCLTEFRKTGKQSIFFIFSSGIFG